MYYRIRFTNPKAQKPKNTWYQVTRIEPATNAENEVIFSGRLHPIESTIAYLEGSYDTFDGAARDIPDEYEDDGKGVFTDPRPVVKVSEWLEEEKNDIIAMAESRIDSYICEQEEEADIEGVILSGDIRDYILSLRAGKKKVSKKF